MGVILRRTAKGVYPYWIGRWEEDGKRRETTLVRWRGTPPGRGEKEGDKEFEKSRVVAENLFKRIRAKGRGQEEEAALVQKIHAARYGGKVGRVKLAELADRWDELPGKDEVTPARRARVHAVLGRFVAFMADRFPRVKEAGGLTAEHFRSFLDDVARHGVPAASKAKEKRAAASRGGIDDDEVGGVSARTWNDVLVILRGVLAKVDGQSEGFREYLAKLPKKDEQTVHRRPFSNHELEEIFAAAEELDPELYPVIVAAACTALRRGDVAQLHWADVDMDAGFVTVKTSKTGESVEIPIFAPFAAVLADAERTRRAGVPYVFPGVARAYKTAPDSLDRRLRRVLAAAGFVTPGKVDAGEFPAPSTPGEAVEKVNAGMVAGRWSETRRQKGLAILQRHLGGETGKAIAAAMGIARGAVSAYLHEMEQVGKVALVSPAATDTPRKATLAERKEGETRARAGSLCGWHSFRTTFCSLALANGVPMELLTRITGHKTAEIVEKYYNQSKREQSRRAFGAAMPRAIAGAVEDADRVEEFEAVPAEVADAAKMLADADEKTLAAVRKLLAKGAKR